MTGSVPTESAIIPLEVADIRPEDVKWLESALNPERDGYAVGDILALAGQARCRIWRVVGKADGIIVTQLHATPAGVECIIWYLAGRNLIRQKDTLFEQLQNYAKLQGAKWLSCWASRKGLVRLYESMGIGYVATVLRKEL